MKKWLIAILFLLCFSFSFAEWKSEKNSEMFYVGEDNYMYIRGSRDNTIDFDVGTDENEVSFRRGPVFEEHSEYVYIIMIIDDGKIRIGRVNFIQNSYPTTHFRVTLSTKESRGLYEEMKKGNKLKIAVVGLDSEAKINIPLKGFTEVYNRYRKVY